jgi:hypothetical protein
LEVKIEAWLISIVVDFLLAVLIVRRYRLTVSAVFYDSRSGCKREVETHYTIARSGPIRDNRQKLGKRGAKHHQLMLLIRFGKYVPLGSLRARFERELPATKVETKISKESRSMRYVGKRWTAKALPSEKIPLWASKDERVFDSMRKDAERREKHRKKIRALLDKLMKDAKTT